MYTALLWSILRICTWACVYIYMFVRVCVCVNFLSIYSKYYTHIHRNIHAGERVCTMNSSYNSS